MYNLTQEDFLRIREEAFSVSPDNCYQRTFEVMQLMFPGYLYARRSSFPCEEDADDCLSGAQIQIVERIRRKYFEREDMEKSPESLQKWMFAVLKNYYFSLLRKSTRGRDFLQQLQEKAEDEYGVVHTADGGKMLTDEPATDGGFGRLIRAEEEKERQEHLNRCFDEILSGRSAVQIVLAWLAVGVLVLYRNVPNKDAIALITDGDPTMGELFTTTKMLLRGVPWMNLTEEDWQRLESRLDRTGDDGRPVRELRFGDFTTESPREYVSKSINKRNKHLTEIFADDGVIFDF